MKNTWSDRIITLLSLGLILGSPGIGYLAFSFTQDIRVAWGVAILAVVAGFIASIFTKVGEGLAERWSARLVDKLDSWTLGILSGFKKKYRDHIIHRHRFFDVKGLTTQGIYTLELAQIFVALKIAPRAVHQASADPTRQVPEGFRRGQTIWKYLSARQLRKQNLVIIGPPGSGKTTLLKHIALALVSGRGKRKQAGAPKKLPILLFLREHAKAIQENPKISLPQVIDRHLENWARKAPAGWFESRLEKGQCLVMLDGLDEVAGDGQRKAVVAWVQRQMERYAGNRFIVTSRPYGYRKHRLKGVTVLEVSPFSRAQVRQFVQNWYLANEVMSAQRDDAGVRQDARKGAADLMRRLQSSADLSALAVNPLLLTMIATVHRYKSRLPGRRVELYKEIHEAFLGQRREARGLELDMTPAQKQRVLQPLAYEMMRARVREIPTGKAVRVIAPALKRVSPQSGGELFLKSVENGSGLLLEKENGVYAFAHKTFQEYLAAVHALDQNLGGELARQVNDDWWHETIRLYAAQTDASAIIAACLAGNPPPILALTLAMECSEEALEIHPTLRLRLEAVLSQGVEALSRGKDE